MRKPGPYCFLIGTVCRCRCDHYGLETWSPFPEPVLAPGNGETKTGRLLGLLFAVIAQQVRRRLRQCGLLTRRTAVRSICSST